jgi:hypothetical protein
MPFSDYIVFTDESGDHSLESIDPQYPLFVLSFCVIRKSIYIDQLTPRVRRLKMDTFGHETIVLHEYDIRKKTGAFAPLSKEARETFMERFNDVMRDTDFTIFAVVIDKVRHKERYFDPAHPYHMAMQFGLERIFGFLRLRRQQDRITHIICEGRGKNEDRELELAFRRVCDGGNFQRERLPFQLIIADKKANSEGLQLADLTARPIGLSVLRPDQRNRAMELIDPKFSRSRGEKMGIGLKIFP